MGKDRSKVLQMPGAGAGGASGLRLRREEFLVSAWLGVLSLGRARGPGELQWEISGPRVIDTFWAWTNLDHVWSPTPLCYSQAMQMP